MENKEFRVLMKHCKNTAETKPWVDTLCSDSESSQLTVEKFKCPKVDDTDENMKKYTK